MGVAVGESDTVLMSNGEFWSFVHASDRSAGVVDSCGAPVAFPGCLVIYRSRDGGATFTLPGDPPACQIACSQCPCPEEEHVRQQQYPRVFFDGTRLSLVYEYLGRVMVRRSLDTVTGSTRVISRCDSSGCARAINHRAARGRWKVSRNNRS